MKPIPSTISLRSNSCSENAVKWACPVPGLWLDNYTRKATPPVEDIQERGPKLHEPGSEGLR